MISATPARLEGGLRAVGLTPYVRQAMQEAAARALMPRFRKLADHEREEKSAGEIVTVADRDCEAMLSEALSRILPAASIVGEEAAHVAPKLFDALGDDLCWIVDPLDGTAYFAAGQAPFGVMVTLAMRGEAVGGWILEPLSTRFCWSAVGQGCWIDGRRIKRRASTGRATLGLSPLLKRRPQRFEAAVSRLSAAFELSEIPRCAAAHYPAMLLGAPDLTLYERTLPWDHGAGALLIEEAGGRAARLDGSPYRIDDDRTGLLVAVDPTLWERAAGMLAELPE